MSILTRNSKSDFYAVMIYFNIMTIIKINNEYNKYIYYEANLVQTVFMQCNASFYIGSVIENVSVT